MGDWTEQILGKVSTNQWITDRLQRYGLIEHLCYKYRLNLMQDTEFIESILEIIKKSELR